MRKTWVYRYLLAMIMPLAMHCGSVLTPIPTEAKPVAGCFISCPNGLAGKFGTLQHKCKGDKRWLLDVTIIGRYTTHGADGGVLTDLWITRVWNNSCNCWVTEDRAVRDVVLKRCSDYQREQEQSKQIEYGRYPGQDGPVGSVQ